MQQSTHYLFQKGGNVCNNLTLLVKLGEGKVESEGDAAQTNRELGNATDRPPKKKRGGGLGNLGK